MATRPNIVVPTGIWYDLNAALNEQAGYPAVTLGQELSIKLESPTQVRLCEKSTQPTAIDGFRRVTDINTPYVVTNDVGTWAYSVGEKSYLNIEVAE